MKFDLSEEQYMVRNSVEAAFSSYNSDGKLVARYDSDTSFDEEAWTLQMDMGLAGVMVPTERGGVGLDMLTMSNISELNGYYAISSPLDFQSLAAWALVMSGDENIIDRWLQPVLCGEVKATVALTEAAGSLPENWTIDSTLLYGNKTFVPFAADADIMLVGVEGGGVSLVVMDEEAVKVVPIDTLDKSRPLYSVTFNCAKGVPLGSALGERLYDAILIGLAADAYGAARHCLEMTLDYVKSREQFGKTIAEFQSVRHQLAQCALELEPSKYLYWYAAHCWDTRSGGASKHASLAKFHIGNVAVNVARASVELHGGIGFAWEYPLHVWLKRAMADQSYFGGASAQASRAACLSNW